jgi:PAT family beta-lactamase induction signal transducer AmpG
MGTVAFFCTIGGTLLGGALTTAIGMGHSLWIFGFLQIFSNLGYILIIWSGGNTPLMYAAMGFETLTTGLGMGAFGALLMRMTQKRFSATQYALFSSLFALSRLAAGPVTGFMVHAAGWEAFFWFTMIAGIPGLVLLARFVPPGTREPVFTVEPPRYREPLRTPALVLRGVVGGVAGLAAGLLVMAGLAALETAAQGGGGFDLVTPLADLLRPGELKDGLQLLGATVFGIVCGLLTSAVAAARHGAAVDAAEQEAVR